MIFIGGINRNNDAQGGQEAKNQQILMYLERNSITATIIDTHNWKKRLPLILTAILRHTVMVKHTPIYLALSYKSLNTLLQLLNALGVTKRNPVYYIVIGGKVHQWLADNPQHIKNFKPLTCIYPESAAMVIALKKIGLQQVKQLPNFKTIPQLRISKTYMPIKFVFLSRILPEKGVDLIIEATKLLNAKGLQNVFTVSYYGNFDDALHDGYPQEFTKAIAAIPNITYKGFLKLNKVENYNILSRYNAMLFPTYWKGEGYPGVLIDAFIAHLPVIASDWHHNKELVFHKDNGLIIPPKNATALADAMTRLIEDVPLLKHLERGAQNSIETYNIDKVLAPIIAPK